MFCYCGNNPTIYHDLNGLCREVGPNLIKVLDCRRSDCKLSGYYIENQVIRATTQIAEAAIKNLNAEVGIGLGLYFEKDFADLLSLSGGIRYDLITVGLSHGEFYSNQAYFSGIDGTALWVFDFDIYAENKTRESPFAEEVGPWKNDDNEVWVADGSGAYFFGGGRYHIGFDIISFCEEVNQILR